MFDDVKKEYDMYYDIEEEEGKEEGKEIEQNRVELKGE